MIPKRTCLVFSLLTFLAACSMLPAQQMKESPTRSGPTSTACSCSDTGVATPTGGLKAAGPALSPAQETTPVSAGTEPAHSAWVTYANPSYGFSFEYPAVYASKDYDFCTVRANSSAPQGTLFALALGSRTNLTLSQSSQSLQEAAAAFQADPSRKDFQFDASKERTVGGAPAIVLSYRSGGTNRYAEAVFFLKNGTLYRVDTGTPSACDVPALNLKELDAYSHLLDTFQFTK